MVAETVHNTCSPELMISEAVYNYTVYMYTGTHSCLVFFLYNYTFTLERMVGEAVHNTCSPELMIGKTVNNYKVHRSSWLPSLCTTTPLRWNAWLARPRQLFMYIGTRD